VPLKIRNVLTRYGVIASRNLQLSGDMMKRGYELYRDALENASRASGDVKAIEESIEAATGPLDQWAEELAVMNRARNTLEKRLRQLVLNFLRFDSLNDKAKPQVIDRVTAVLPKEQRARLKGRTGEDIIEEFLWTDLLKLI